KPTLASGYLDLTRSTWAYIDSQAPTTVFLDRDGDAPVGTFTGTDQKAHTYRSYFTYDLSQLSGQAVHSALLYAGESPVPDCSAAATIEVWRPQAVKTNTSWRRPPAELELLNRFPVGSGHFCPGIWGTNVFAALTAALARHDTTMTVEV